MKFDRDKNGDYLMREQDRSFITLMARQGGFPNQPPAKPLSFQPTKPNKKPWTPAEDKSLVMYRKGGFTPLEAAQALNRPVPSILRRAIALKMAFT